MSNSERGLFVWTQRNRLSVAQHDFLSGCSQQCRQISRNYSPVEVETFNYVDLDGLVNDVDMERAFIGISLSSIIEKGELTIDECMC